MSFAGQEAIVMATLLAALVISSARAEEIYKSVDAQGHVVYSDRPSTAAAQKTALSVQEADPAEAARLANEHQLLKAEDDQRKRQQMVADRAKAQQDHDKQARCQAARDRYYAVKDVSRIYKLDAEGNRVYYTDAEADARRATARQAMTTACGT